MPDPIDLGITAIRLEFSDGNGVILIVNEEGYSLFDVERFCWLNADLIWGLLGSFVGASEMQKWASLEEFEAWRADPSNAAKFRRPRRARRSRCHGTDPAFRQYGRHALRT